MRGLSFFFNDTATTEIYTSFPTRRSSDLGNLRERLLDLCLTRADLRLRLAQLRLRLKELSLGLVDGRLERPRIDLKHQVAGLGHGAFRVVLTHEVAADAGADLRGDVPDERADVLDGHRH